MAEIIKHLPDGTYKMRGVYPKDGEVFALQEIYDLLDCTLVEVLPSMRNLDILLVVDEEGKLKGKERNTIAEMVLRDHGIYATIAGDMLVCTMKEFGE